MDLYAVEPLVRVLSREAVRLMEMSVDTGLSAWTAMGRSFLGSLGLPLDLSLPDPLWAATALIAGALLGWVARERVVARVRG